VAGRRGKKTATVALTRKLLTICAKPIVGEKILFGGEDMGDELRDEVQWHTGLAVGFVFASTIFLLGTIASLAALDLHPRWIARAVHASTPVIRADKGRRLNDRD